MSNFIVEEELGTFTGRRHPNNGYFALRGPVMPAGGSLNPSSRFRPTVSGRYEWAGGIFDTRLSSRQA